MGTDAMEGAYLASTVQWFANARRKALEEVRDTCAALPPSGGSVLAPGFSRWVADAGSRMRGQTYTLHFIASPFAFPRVQLRIELLEKALAIGGVVKNGLARVASESEVIKRPGEFETRRPGL